MSVILCFLARGFYCALFFYNSYHSHIALSNESFEGAKLPPLYLLDIYSVTFTIVETLLQISILLLIFSFISNFLSYFSELSFQACLNSVFFFYFAKKKYVQESLYNG